MPTTFRRYEPDQMLLPPTDLREWLPDGRLGVERQAAAKVVGCMMEVLRAHRASHRRPVSPCVAITQCKSSSCSTVRATSTLHLPPFPPRSSVYKIVETSYGADS